MYWYYVCMSLLRPRSFWPILVGFTSLGRIDVIIPTILWLASVGFIVHYLHPSITFQLILYPDLLLDLWHGGPFPTRAFVLDKLPYLFVSRHVYLCLDSELPRLCWLNLKQIELPSIQCIWKWNEYLVKSPFMKRSVSEHIHECKASLMKLALKCKCEMWNVKPM